MNIKPSAVSVNGAVGTRIKALLMCLALTLSPLLNHAWA